MGTTEVGQEIVDAYGRLHDLSKGAFDAFGMTHGGEFDPNFGELLRGSFNDGVKSILKKNGLSIDALDSWGSGEWVETVKSFISGTAASLTGEYGTEIISATTGAIVGGPMGAALAVAIEVGGKVIRKTWDEYRAKMSQFGLTTYGPGQWVAIDNGEVPAITNVHNVLDDENWRRRLGAIQQRPDIVTGEGVPFKESMSVGFVIGEGQRKNSVQVFNFMKSREETKTKNEIAVLDQGHAGEMDINPVWSEIRLLYFEEDAPSRLDSDVNTDPGSEVIFEGDRYLIVQSNGTQIHIESKANGTRRWVTIDQLKAGRRPHNNSWNYQNGEVSDGFDGSDATLFIGAFIWIRPQRHIKSKYPNVERQLACIYELEGQSVKAFTCVDGHRVLIQLYDNELRPVSDSMDQFLNHTEGFTRFKDAAVRGFDVKQLAPGKNRETTLLTLGITPLDQQTEKVGWREKTHSELHQRLAAHRKELRGLQTNTVGRGEDEVAINDMKEDAMRLGSKYPSDALIEEIPEGEGGEERTQTDPGSTSQTAMILGVLGVGLAIYFIA